MTKAFPIPPRDRPHEDGYILIVLVFMLAVLMIALTVAVPVVKKQIQRDQELETMHRGKQYVRAVKMYYAKFGAYPPSIDALVNTNQVRFLRKKYIDPTTGKADWKIIHVGENKTRTMGFFGQPIGGGTIAGTGPGSNGPNPSAGMPNSPGGGSSIFGSTDSGTTPVTPPDAAGSPSNPPGGAGSGATGATGAAGTDPNAPNGAAGTGLNGQTFGGAGMIGVSPASTKQSILVYKKKNHYNDWEFFYDPLADQMMMQGGNAGAIGQPAGSTTTPVGQAAPNTSSTPTTPASPPTSTPMAPAPQQ
jgi:type II secretory pathway pseudopilin PulG